MSSADYDNHTPHPIKKKFCGKCGRPLKEIERLLGYNEYDGKAIKAPPELVCPVQNSHDDEYVRNARLRFNRFGEDLDD